MLGFIVVVSCLTYILPQGEYTRAYDPELQYDTVVPGSFRLVDAESLSLTEILLSIPEGIASRADLMVLIFLVGGAFFVVEKTGAIREGVISLTNALEGKEIIALIFVSTAFAGAGAANGFQEEIIALMPVLLFFTGKLGYDTYVAVAVSYGSAVVGAALSPINPFGVAVAQKMANLPLLSGSGYRMIVFFVVFVLWNFLIIGYAKKNRIEKTTGHLESSGISFQSIVILVMTGCTFILMIYGLLFWDWGFNEISVSFFTLGIISGITGKMGMNGTAEGFIAGFREMAFAALLIGFASCISLILEKGMIIDTIVYGLFTPLQFLPKSLAAVFMMISQAALHIPIPSYSGQALMTLPILSPLSDLVGISRQVCVLAYQYGAITMDMIIPTNGALMAVISIAGIPYNKWLSFLLKPLMVLLAAMAIAIIISVFIGYGN